mmetsp:Transcript_8173/g.12221  ORF Transcript_8173/g.12221 Transcript_8173/m.12221 type:complete len:363 (+) Transcript_8173:430-1518(+)
MNTTDTAAGKRPSGCYHGAQNEKVARKEIRQSLRSTIKDYPGHQSETSSKKWPRIPPVPNINPRFTLQEALDMIKTILPSHGTNLTEILTNLKKRIHILDTIEDVVSTMQSFESLDEQRNIYVELLEVTMRAVNLLGCVIEAGHNVELSIAEDLSQFIDEPLSSLAANLLTAFELLCSRHEDNYKSLMVTFDEMLCNDPLFNINYTLRAIDSIVSLDDDHIDGIDDNMDGITDRCQKSTSGTESIVSTVGCRSKTTDGVFSEFTPSRDSYDLNQESKTHCECSVKVIVSKFYPPRDSFDPKSQPFDEYHDLPYRFSNEYIPHRDSIDLMKGTLNHQVVPFRYHMKFIPYQDSYDKLSVIASE